MRNLIIVIAVILSVFVLSFWAVLEKPEDQARFHIQVPLPPESDVADVDEGIYGGRVLIGAMGDPKTLNPVVSSENSSTDVISRLFSALVAMDNVTQEIVPSLAERWEFSEDGLELTFYMRRGVVWSDGVPLTAYDAEFSYDAIYDPNVANSLADIMRVNGEAFEYAAIDSFTFRVRIPSTFAPFLMWAGGAVPVLPKHILKPELDKGTFDSAYNISWPEENFISSGPYMLEKFESGVKTVLRRNPAYWRVDRAGNRLPFIERIIHVNVQSLETMLLMFQTGQLDMNDSIKPADVPILEKDAEKYDFSIVNLGPAMSQTMFWFNLNPGKNEAGKPFVAPHKLKWFQDVRFRKAMSYAVDREGMAQTVYNGLAQPQLGPETPANKIWYNPNLIKYDYNLDKSRELLDDMGLIDRDGDGIREDADGNPVEFSMITNTGNDLRELMGNIVKDDLANIGIQMNFTPIEFNTLIVKIDNEYDYECCLLGLSSGDPDPSSGMSVWLSSGSMHQWYPSQPEPATEWEARIDELMNLQITTLDTAKRKEYYDEVQYIISDMCPYIYTVTPEIFVAVSNKYKNLEPTIMEHKVLWNIEEVWQE